MGEREKKIEEGGERKPSVLNKCRDTLSVAHLYIS